MIEKLYDYAKIAYDKMSKLEEGLEFRSFYAGYMEGYLDSEMNIPTSNIQNLYIEEGDMNENDMS